MIEGLGNSVSSRGFDAIQLVSLVGALPAPQKKALAFLMRNGPAQPTVIGEATGMGDDAAGQSIQSLVKIGVVEQQAGRIGVPEQLQKILAKTSILRGYGY